jgi:adenylate cyclase
VVDRTWTYRRAAGILGRSVLERRLAAILAADVVGYSRLMAEDEESTLGAVTTNREVVVRPEVHSYGGRIFKLMGDGILVEFPSVVDAVGCALAIQRRMSEEANQRIRLRIGINLGDIIVEGDDIYGDGVNIAARLESIADPDGVCISDVAFQTAQSKFRTLFEDMGPQNLKNIERPIRAWRWVETEAKPAQDKGSGRTGEANKPSIVVGEFANRSSIVEQDHFADGIADDLSIELSRYPGLFVISRNSIAPYRGQTASARQIGTGLGVQYVIEGTIRRSGDRVRIVVQLIDGQTGEQLWSDRYDRVLEDIFAVQDEIAHKVAGLAGARLLSSDMDRVMRRQLRDLDAYEHALRGRAHYRLSTRDDNDKSKQEAEASIALDPTFALGHAVLAYALVQAYRNGWANDQDQILTHARMHALKAVSLDGNDVWSHAAFGSVETILGNHDAAIAEFERAISLCPSGAFILLGCANALCAADRPGDALAAIQRAMLLDPHYPAMYLIVEGRALLGLERFGKAVEVLERAVSALPQYPNARTYLAAALVGAKRLEEAVAEVAKLRELSPALSLRHFAQRPGGGHEQQFLLELLRNAGLPDESVKTADV